ncbi:MAG: hypothetical protein HY804_12280 [Nitrospinae bacterium]|nr:hypothetical protein [Nitrospinota bacterium]
MPENKTAIERELLETFIAATKKGMTAEEFFAVAETALKHLRGGQPNETIDKIIKNTATPQDLERLLQSLHKP